MESGFLLPSQPRIQALDVPELSDRMEHQDEEQQLARLQAKVATLLRKDQTAVQCLSAAQCHSVINIFKRMQRARDTEIIQMLKPYTDSLDELLPRLKSWKQLCHGSGLSQPHAELIFKLDTLAKTKFGMKPGSFSLEHDVLIAIETSNKVLRALAVESKYVGLSKPMASVKHNVKEMMVDIQRLLSIVIDARQPVPGARFRPSDVLDATKGQVVLRKGRPFYVDPQDGDLVICGPKHPLLRYPGSEWNKWIRIPRSEWDGLDNYFKVNIPDGAFRHLREQFTQALQIEGENTATRYSAFHGAFHNGKQEAEFREYRRAKDNPVTRQEEREIDFEHAEMLDWDMSTYLKMLDHKGVDYTRAPPPEDFQKGPWYYLTVGADFINFLHPGYCNLLGMRNDRLDHPCEFRVFEELDVDFSKMRITPEEANGVLTPYLYEDAATGDDFENDPEEVENIPMGQFSREGLYLDTRRDWMRVRGLAFLRPQFQRPY